jgi:hypothetical protein
VFIKVRQTRPVAPLASTARKSSTVVFSQLNALNAMPGRLDAIIGSR